MRMSEKRRTKLYTAISEEIMGLRIELAHNPQLVNPDEVDTRLFWLELGIWQKVKRALGLEPPSE